MLRRVVLAAGLLASTALAGQTIGVETDAVDASEGKPNILMVYVDDLGYGDIGYNNQEFSRATRHLNMLAESGIVLDQFYTSPTCTASRASLMTGRYPASLGLQDSVIHSTEPRGLDLDQTLLPEKLGELGYRSIALGKWHLGFHQSDYLPHKRGFDEFYGILTGGGDHFKHTSTGSFAVRGTEYKSKTYLYSGLNMWANDQHVDEAEVADTHSTDLYTDKALEFLKASTEDEELAGQPWFMYLAYQAVHAPMQATDEYVDGTVKNGCKELHSEDKTFSQMRTKLCGMVSMVDESTMRLVTQLKKSKVWDKTLVVFLSDNGGIVRHGSSNAPLRGEKGEYYEGGIRVPAFMSGGFLEKELLRTATKPYTSTALCHVTDVHATVLSVAGAQTDPGAIDGVDQWSSLVSAGPSARGSILHNINSDLFGNAGALRMGDYKLIVSSRVTESEIYTYGQTMLQDSDWDMTELSQVIHQKLLRNPGEVAIYNIAKNPTEEDAGDCLDAEACTNLYDNAAFAAVQAELLAKWDEYIETVPESTEEWVDDGPLADPEHFGGYWTPWRDTSGIPYATYHLAEETHHTTLAAHEPAPAEAKQQAAGAGENVPEDAPAGADHSEPRERATNTEDEERRRLMARAASPAHADAPGVVRDLALTASGVLFGVFGAVFFMQRQRREGAPTAVEHPAL